MADPAKTVDQNLLPVQAYFNLDGSFNTFIGQGQPFYATANPVQSGLTITNSTIDSTTIGATTPSTGVFTNISTTTGSISTTPSSATNIANKFYVDTVAQGLGPKAACQVGTTANITLSGLQTIDGYTTVANDRVLVKNQSLSQYNGIYVASASTWTREVDMDVWSEVPGAYTVILNGGQSDTGWVCTATQTGTINVTAMPWVQFSGANTYYAGTGLSLSSNTFSISNTGVSAGSYGSASNTLSATVNAQGQLTSLSSQAISIAPSQINATIPNSGLTNSSITVNGTNIALGGSATITATAPYALTIGTGLLGTSYNGSAPVTIAIDSTVATLTGTQTLTNKTLTSPVISTISNTGTLTLPTSTDTLVGRATTDTLTNKSISGSTNTLTNIGNGSLTNSSITIGSTSISLGSTASTLTSVTMATPTISSYETYTAVSAPSYNAGRLWYDSTQNALAYYNDVTNNTIHIGEEIQLKVYNNTGSQINVGQPVYVTSTSSGYTYPNVALAIANSLTTGNVIGLANQNIPNGTAGYVTTIGLIQGVNTGSYTVGDTLYLSPYSAGYYQNTIPPTGYAIKLGTVAYVNSSNGAIYVNKSILTVQAGNINGQVSLSNGGTGANLTASAGAVVYSTSSAFALTSVGSTGQVLTSNGTSAPTWSTITASIGVTDDTSSNVTEYGLFGRVTSGTLATVYTASTQVKFNPSTGIFQAPIFSGSGANLTSIPNGALTNSTISGISLGSNLAALTIGTGLSGTSYNGSTGVTIANTGVTSITGTASQITASASTGAVTLSLPSTINVNTSGTAANVTGTVAIANGGTGQTTTSAAFNALSPITTTGDLIIGNGTNSATRLGIGTNGFVLTSNGTTASWSPVVATTATNLAGGATGSVPYQSTTATTAFLAGNTTTTPNFYTSTGTGVVAQAPTLTTSTGSGSVVLATRPTMSVTGAGFTLQDDTDNTKQAQFALAGSQPTGTTKTYQLPLSAGTGVTLAGLSTTQTFSGINTFSQNVSFTSTTGDVTAQSFTTANLLLGGTSQTGNVYLGQSTATYNVGIANGATASGKTQTINIGNAALAGSTTTITIGSTAGTSTTTLNGSVSFNSAISGALTANTLNTQDTTFTISNATDSSKKAVFDLSGLTSSTTRIYTLPNISGSTLATLGNLAQTFTGATSVLPTTASSTITLGSTTSTGAITVGQSTANQTVNLATGATSTGNTKTVNIATNSATGSTTNITIGSTSGTSSTTLNGSVTAAGSIIYIAP